MPLWNGRKEAPAQPKDEPMYPSVVNQMLDEINRIERQINERGGQRDARIRRSNMLLKEERDSIMRKLIYECDSIPVYDEVSGLYKLYKSRGEL